MLLINIVVPTEHLFVLSKCWKTDHWVMLYITHHC